jgi:hypothetical protein
MVRNDSNKTENLPVQVPYMGREFATFLSTLGDFRAVQLIIITS